LTDIDLTATSWSFMKANLLYFTFSMYSVDTLLLFWNFGYKI